MKAGINKIVESSLFTKLIAPLSLFVLCFIVRLVYLTAQDICIDEPFSIYHAQGSVSDIIRFLKPTNNPPLFEIILHYWVKVFGISAFSVRFLPVLFGSLTVIYIYKIAIRYFSFRVAMTASLLYVFSTHAIYYAHDCRVYTLFLFLALVSVYYSSKIISGNFVKRDMILLCFINAAFVYAHYFGFIVWFVECIAFIFLTKNRIREIVFLFFASSVFYIPQILVLINRFIHSAGEGTWLKEPVGLESIYNMLWLFSNMPVMAAFCILIIVAALAKFFFVKNGNSGNRAMKNLIYLCFFLPFFLMFLISYKIPVYNGRYLFFILPFYYLSISVMVSDLFEKNIIKSTLSGILIAGFVFTFQANPSKKREAQKVVEFVKSEKKPGDLVIICSHEFLTNFAYYYNEDIFKITSANEYEAIESKLKKENVFPVRNISEISKAVIDSATRIIYVDAGADFSNPGNNVLSALENKFGVVEKKHFEEIFNVYVFPERKIN